MFPSSYFLAGIAPMSVHLSVLWVPCLWIFFALQVSFQSAGSSRPPVWLEDKTKQDKCQGRCFYAVQGLFCYSS